MENKHSPYVKYLYVRTMLKYYFVVFLPYLILCYFIHSINHISEGNVVLFIPLYLYLMAIVTSYFADSDFLQHCYRLNCSTVYKVVSLLHLTNYNIKMLHTYQFISDNNQIVLYTTQLFNGGEVANGVFVIGCLVKTAVRCCWRTRLMRAARLNQNSCGL